MWQKQNQVEKPRPSNPNSLSFNHPPHEASPFASGQRVPGEEAVSTPRNHFPFKGCLLQVIGPLLPCPGEQHHTDQRGPGEQVGISHPSISPRGRMPTAPATPSLMLTPNTLSSCLRTWLLTWIPGQHPWPLLGILNADRETIHLLAAMPIFHLLMSRIQLHQFFCVFFFFGLGVCFFLFLVGSP